MSTDQNKEGEITTTTKVNYNDLHLLLSQLEEPIINNNNSQQQQEEKKDSSDDDDDGEYDRFDTLTLKDKLLLSLAGPDGIIPSSSAIQTNSQDGKKHQDQEVKNISPDSATTTTTTTTPSTTLDLSSINKMNNNNNNSNNNINNNNSNGKQQQQPQPTPPSPTLNQFYYSDQNSSTGDISSVGTMDSNPNTPKSPHFTSYQSFNGLLNKEISLENMRQVTENSPLIRGSKQYGGKGNHLPRLELQDGDEDEEDVDESFEEDEQTSLRHQSSFDDDDTCSSTSESEEVIVLNPSLRSNISETGSYQPKSITSGSLRLKQQIASKHLEKEKEKELLQQQQQQPQQLSASTPSPTVYDSLQELDDILNSTLNNSQNGQQQNIRTSLSSSVVEEMNNQLRKSGIRISPTLNSSSRLPNQRVGSIRLKLQQDIKHEEDYFNQQEQQQKQQQEEEQQLQKQQQPQQEEVITIEKPIEPVNREDDDLMTKIIDEEKERLRQEKIVQMRDQVFQDLDSLRNPSGTVKITVPVTITTTVGQSPDSSSNELNLNLPSGSGTAKLSPFPQRLTTRPRNDSVTERWDIGNRRSQSLNIQRIGEEFSVQRTNLSLKKPNPNMDKMLIHISLVDQSHKVICITEDFFVQDVILLFAEKLGLVQIEFFSLSEPTLDGCDRWLDPSKLVKDAGIKNLSKLVLKIRYFKQPKKLSDSKAVHLYYLQIQQNVALGVYPCSEAMAFRLAALQFYITFGAHDKDQHQTGFLDHATLLGFIPASHFYNNSDEYMQRRLFKLHSQIKCNSVIEAKLRYLDLANKIPTFGVTTFTVHDFVREATRHQRQLCVAEDGLLISRKDRPGYDFFPFKDILSWTVNARGIKIQIPFSAVTPNTSESMVFDTSSTEQSNNIADLLTGYKYFIQYDNSQKGLCPPPVVDFSISSQFNLFQPPRQRTKSDPLRSRLELFKSIYLQLCSNYNSKHMLKFVDQIDEILDKEGSFRNKLQYQTIDLSNINIRAGDLSFLSDALRDTNNTICEEGETIIENLSLETLDLSNNPLLGSDLAEPLKLLLENAPSIVNLNFKNIGISTKGLLTILPLLEKRTNITTLQFGKNRILDAGVKAIIKRLKNTTITTLGLEETVLLDSGCIIIQKLLKKSKSLVSLNISKNRITENGFKLIFEGLKENTMIKELYMSGNPIQHKLINRFLQYIASNPNQLTKLSIASTSLSSGSGSEIQKVLVSNGCHLEQLDVSLNNLGTTGTKYVIKGAAVNNTITDLSLSGNKISDSGCIELCQSLELTTCKLSKLSLRYCNLNAKSIARVCKMIESNKTITSLDLSMNKFNKSSCLALSNSLQINNTLDELFITNSEIGSKEFTILCPGLQNNHSIKKIYFDINPIGKKGLGPFTEVINNNKVLEVVTMRNISINCKDVIEFLKKISTSTTLEKLNLSENPIFDNKTTAQMKTVIEDNCKRLTRVQITL